MSDNTLSTGSTSVELGVHLKNLNERAPTASVGIAPVPSLTPEEAVRFIGSRQVDESKMYKPSIQPHVGGVEGPDSIAELARALQNNPDLIFQWVYNNIEYHPTFGEAKGALNCLVDGVGNAFDQCELLFALLTQAGLTPSYALGQIEMTAAQLSAWLGTDSSNLTYAYNILNNGGIPVQYVNSNTQLKFTHLWVTLVISGTKYVFDPSIKTYTTTAGINIGTATGYSQATLLAQAETGATIDPNGLFVQNVNSADLEAQMTTYATNLQDYIQTNMPAASLANVIGGRSVITISTPVRQTTQPYEVPGDVPLVWTAIPNSYRISVNVLITNNGTTELNMTFYGSDIHGQRFTLWVDNSADNPILRRLYLNGTQLATFTSPTPPPVGYNSVLTYAVTYPYATTFANASVQESINGSYQDGLGNDHTFQYLLSFCFGPIGQGRVDYWQNQVQINQLANSDTRSEPNMGSTLGLLWNTRAATFSALVDILGRMSQCKNIWHHQIGTTYWTGSSLTTATEGSYAFNLNGVTILTEALNANATANACALTLGVHDGCTERMTLQQVAQVLGAAAPATFIDAANHTSTKLYKITPANMGTTLPLLSGYQSDATAAFTQQLNQGYSLLIPQTAPQAIQGGVYQVSGAGWIPFNTAAMFGYIADTTLTKGGLTPNCPPFTPPKKKKNPCDCEGQDPVDERTGDYRYKSSDMTVGSSQFPYALEFKSMYDSRLVYNNGILGLGWNYNWNYAAAVTSEPQRSMGSESGVEAALTITELFVSLDLNSDTTQPVTKLAVIFISANWWATQLTWNAVNLSFPEGDYTYVLLPDGTYQPQQNDNGILVNTSSTGGSCYHTTPQQQVRYLGEPITPRAAPSLMSQWTFPEGVTISLQYSSGVLQSITNNMGRTLTLGYTGNFLSSVTDGNSRTVNYSVNTTTNLLSSISDALANVTTFGYDSSSRFYQYFKPQNPTKAVVTNSYDTLSRISSQLDIYGNKTSFYFAGSRSQFTDPAGNSKIDYYDSQNNLIQAIDELGNVTSYAHDGHGRVSLLTYPEGNGQSYVYDTYNNVLSVTYKPKPGSPLANIVNSFTYDPTFNKVHTSVDGKLQTTTYTYDSIAGTLLTVQKPLVNGVTPTVTYFYNARGQVLSTIDATGIQTLNNYDTTTEKLLSKVVNANSQATIGGTVTVGNILTITGHDTLLSGGQEAISYTVKTGDTLTSIAIGLAAAVNADANFAAVGIFAYSNAAVVSLSVASSSTTFTESVSGGATETITVVTGLKLTKTFGYDSVGNVNSFKDALSNTTSFVFDKSRRLTSRTEATPFSYVTMYGYDMNNNVTSIQAQTGNVMNPEQTYMMGYTLSDKIKTVTDPATNVTTKTYDNFDRLWTVTDAQLKKTTFLYDQRSKLFTVTDSSNTISETRTYTNNGKLYQLSDARTKTTTYSYDGFDRANETLYADSSFEQNSSYDANNNNLIHLTRSGSMITNTFDPLDRLSTKAPQGQATVTYLYDLFGRLLSATTPVVSGNPATGAFSFTYDTVGRLIQEQTPDSKTVKYGLDNNSNLTKLTYPDSYYVTRVYDQLNRLTTVKLNGATTSAIGITYDELSRRAILTYGNGATSTYGFQLNNDLTSLAEAFIGSSVTLTYGFNKVHQETSRAVTDGTYLWHPGTAGTTTYAAANSVNEYPTVGSASYLYDGNGNLKSDGTWTYVYDTENHLLSANKTGVSASYVYDGLHRQIQKTVGSTSTRYYYAGWQRLADYSGTTLQNRHVYGAGLDEALIEVSNAGVLTYLHADRLGSIIATTNSSGAIVSKTVYGPSGEGAPPTGTTFGYTGQRYDAETGLYHYKRRNYSPVVGRFLQPDPVGYGVDIDDTCACGCSDDCAEIELGQLNLFTYVYNDPLNYTDRLGLRGTGPNPVEIFTPLTPLQLILTIIVGGIIYVITTSGSGDQPRVSILNDPNAKTLDDCYDSCESNGAALKKIFEETGCPLSPQEYLQALADCFGDCEDGFGGGGGGKVVPFPGSGSGRVAA